MGHEVSPHWAMNFARSVPPYSEGRAGEETGVLNLKLYLRHGRDTSSTAPRSMAGDRVPMANCAADTPSMLLR